MTIRLCLLTGLAMHVGAFFTAPAAAQNAENPIITRDIAVLWALQDAPEIEASQHFVQSREELIENARRRPNPRLNVEMENLGGSGPYGLAERTETTATLSQLYERGGDLEARTQLAQSEVRLANIRLQITELDLVESVEMAVLDVQLAQAHLRLAEERHSSLEEIGEIVTQRVRAARDPLLAQERLQAQISQAQIDIDIAEQDLISAREYLNGFWTGRNDIRVEPATFELSDITAIPLPRPRSTEEELAMARRAHFEAAISQEVARATPDIDVGLQARHFQNDNEAAIGFSVSIPLQLRNNNQNAIASARLEMVAADRMVENVRRTKLREIRSVTLRTNRISAEIEQIETLLLPQLQQSLASARSGYQRGSATYLEIFDAQLALNLARERRISAFAELYQTQIRMRRLAGTHSPNATR